MKFFMKKDNNKDDNEKNNDNVIYVDAPKEAEENNNRLQEKEKARKKLLLILAIVGGILLIVFAFMLSNREYKGYKVIQTNETNYENVARYIQFSKNLLKYTPDGVSYIDANGNTVWTAGVDMKMPVAVVSGDYAAIADLNGNVVCVFNSAGLVSSVTMPYTICDVDVAKQGAFAVVLESAETNYVNLYDKKGDIVYEMQTTLDKSGYPLDISISDDGKKLFTSYINIGTASVSNNLAAYNFGDVGQNSNADRMVGGYKFDDQIVTKLEFLDNDTVAAFGTSSISIYSMKEKPAEKATIQLDGEIRSIFYSEKYIGTVQNVESDTKEKIFNIKAYDLQGKCKFSKEIDFEYDDIYAADKEIIIYGGNRCVIFRMNGSVKFDGSLSGNILSIVPNGKKLEYVVVYDDRTEIIKLKPDETNEKILPESKGE